MGKFFYRGQPGITNENDKETLAPRRHVRTAVPVDWFVRLCKTSKAEVYLSYTYLLRIYSAFLHYPSQLPADS
jgi:hypothetical protein